MSTVPLTPSTERTRCGWPSRTGMQSVTRTVPVAVSYSVSTTNVSGRYQRRVDRIADGPPAGGDPPKPVLLGAQEPAKHEGESKCGRHSQSMEPSMPTRAAEWRSPITA